MRRLNSEGGHFLRRKKRRKGRRRRRSNSEEADPLPVVLGTLLEGGGVIGQMPFWEDILKEAGTL